MKIGVTSIFPFRPHVENMAFLAHVLEKAGHQTRYLTCDATMDSCFNRLLKKSSPLVTCTTCRAGGIRSYRGRHVQSLRVRDAVPLNSDTAALMSRSSVSSLHRLETKAEMAEPRIRDDIRGLQHAMEIAYGSALRWFEREKLEGLVLFNGRMDATNAIMTAAHKAGLPVLTFERPWFGHGVQLVKGEMCLDLVDQHRFVAHYDRLPLTAPQAKQAARQIVARYGKGPLPDWRIFHADSQATPWPVPTRRLKVLILPSSRGEVQFNPSWEFPYADDMAGAYDDILRTLGVPAEDAVIRAHPIWAQMVGRYDGHSPLRYYRDYASRRGIHFIAPDEKVLTLSLIRQADVVITTGGATAIEAAGLGKPVISVGPAVYSAARAFIPVFSPADLPKLSGLFDLSERERVRSCLRAIYAIESRVPQYTRHMRSITPTTYRYFDGADPERLTGLLQGAPLRSDDETHAADTRAEDEVIDAMMAGQWEGFTDPWEAPGPEIAIHRRWMWSWLDSARALLPPGDRL